MIAPSRLHAPRRPSAVALSRPEPGTRLVLGANEISLQRFYSPVFFELLRKIDAGGRWREHLGDEERRGGDERPTGGDEIHNDIGTAQTHWRSHGEVRGADIEALRVQQPSQLDEEVLADAGMVL